VNGAAGEHICIIDDDEAVRDSLGTMLMADNWAVETYRSADEFLARLDKGGDIGCVVADVRMPGMDGLELQSILAEKSPDTPVIVMTGHGDVSMAVRAMKAGAVDFIEKPFDADALIDRIRDAIAARRSRPAVETPASEVRARIERLTPRERDILRQLIAGQPNKVIAHELGISPRTVEIHRARVMEKMETQNVSRLIRLVLSAGLDPL
jgi:two-component system response regulator FixJ